jgi:hypothetical protein
LADGSACAPRPPFFSSPASLAASAHAPLPWSTGWARRWRSPRGSSAKGGTPEAKETLASIDPRRAGERVRARYALYRGLTLVALGDRGRGSAWLREAWALERARRGTLSERDVQRLRLAVEANELP